MAEFVQPMNNWITHQALTNAVGDEFERYAQFILHLIYKGYTKTRLKKDDGVDGYILAGSLGLRRNMEYFSIYGPESKTSTENKLKKIEDDLDSILKHSSKVKIPIKKWYIVINFDTTFEIDESIRILCEPYLLDYELLYPTKIIGMLEEKNEMFKALAFTTGVPFPDIELTNLHYHSFAERVLHLIVEHEEKSTTTEQINLLDYLYSKLLFYVPLKKMDSKRQLISFSLSEWFYKHTFIYNEEGIFIHEYDLKRKKLYTYKDLESKKNKMPISDIIFFDKENSSVFVKIVNLEVILNLVLSLRKQIIISNSPRYNYEKGIKQAKNIVERNMSRRLRILENRKKFENRRLEKTQKNF